MAAGLGVAALTATLIAGAAPAGAAPTPMPTAPVPLQLLALNDFHGQLERPTGSGSQLPGLPGRNNAVTDANGNTQVVGNGYGGAEYLATQIRALEATADDRNTLTVAAGDLIGASPLLSAAFHDEPTIEALNRIGLDYASVGNHEFDEGPEELLRIQNGGCHPVDGCSDPALPYEGADFQYLSANAFVDATGESLLPEVAIRKVQGIKVGFIGMTLEGTPSVVTPSGVAGLSFGDEAETANRHARNLQRAGAEAIVVLIHEGGAQSGPSAGITVDSCQGLGGAITEIVPRFDDAIDAVVTGHSHQAYNCREVNGTFVPSSSTTAGRLVTSASSAGRLVTDIDLTLDPVTGDVLTSTADNVVVDTTVPAAEDMTELITRWRALIGPIASDVVGNAGETLTRLNGGALTFTNTAGTAMRPATGDSSLGNLIADGQLAATTPGSVASLMNPGGVRADIGTGPITYEEAFSVQPFGNYLTQITLTDAQIQCVLEQQFSFTPNTTVLQPGNLTYMVSRAGRAGAPATTAEPNAPCAGTVVPDDSVKIGGVAIATDGVSEYRFTVNNFLADGGDGFSILRQGTNRQDVADPEDDLAAFIDYLGSFTTPTTAPATGRITQVD
jgi:5'-nucleotidase